MTDHENQLLTQILGTVSDVSGKVDELLEWKNGNGGALGVNVRLDRLEQESAQRKERDARMSGWLMSLFCGGGVTAAIAIWALVKALTITGGK